MNQLTTADFISMVEHQRREGIRGLLERLRSRLTLGTYCDGGVILKTTLRVGGPADIYVEPVSEADLALVISECRSWEQPFFILGRGSNLLVRDGGIRGVVIGLHHDHFRGLRVDGNHLRCGAGLRLKQLAGEAKNCGIGGMEFLEGIPGCVGGALRMNAGAMGSWMFDVVESVRVMDGEGNIRDFTAVEMSPEYRECAMLRNHIALAAVLKGVDRSPEEISECMAEYGKRRKGSQPVAASAGCIFKNPESIGAGRLIDELGLKGFQVGDAMVSEIHGNFIVNSGKASARDVLDLIAVIQQRARGERGIELKMEVQVVGEDLPEEDRI